MNDTSGFQEMRASTLRSSTNRLLDEQRRHFGTSSWALLRTDHLIALSTGSSMNGETISDAISQSPSSDKINDKSMERIYA